MHLYKETYCQHGNVIYTNFSIDGMAIQNNKTHTLMSDNKII